MGNTLQGIFRISGGETKEDKVPYSLYFNRVLSRRSNQNYHHPRNGADLSSTFWFDIFWLWCCEIMLSARLREIMLRLRKATDNTVKVVQQKLKRIIFWFLRPKKSVAQDPVLSLRNPAAPSVVSSSNTLLKDPLLISSVSSSSDYYAELPSDINSADDSVDVSNCQQWPEGIINYSDNMQRKDDQDHHVLVYIPEYTSNSVAPNSNTLSKDPLLISSVSSSSSDYYAELPSDINSADDSVSNCQQWPEEIINYSDSMQQTDDQDHHVLMYIPEYTSNSVAPNSNTLSKDPLLISSVSSSSSDYYAELPSDINSADDSVSNCQQWPEGIINYSDNMQQTDDQDHHVLVYIPEYTSHSVAPNSNTLLKDPLLISSVSSSSPDYYAELPSDINSADDSVYNCKEWPEGIINYSDNMQQTDDKDHHVLVYIPEYTSYSVAPNSNTLLKDPLLISSVSSSSSDYYAEPPSDINSVDDSVYNCQEWPEGIINYSDNMQQTDDQDHHVLVYIPEHTSYSVAGTSANHVADQKDNEQSSSKEEDKEIIYQLTKEIVHQMAKTKRSTVVDESELEEIKQLEQRHVTIKKRTRVEVNEGRRIKHYSSRHRILVVGDGDFSFSACLALAFGCASNMIATSLDSKEFLKKNYQKALSNINELKGRECKVMHLIDATKMANHELLGHLTFDRIIFNFPFAGFFKDLPREAQLRCHRRLVNQFLKNAKEMISENGEIHISHKTNGFHREWMLESMASSHRLRLIEAVNFNHLDYPGYNTKYGFGGDNNFHCYPSKTYKFGLKMVR